MLKILVGLGACASHPQDNLHITDCFGKIMLKILVGLALWHPTRAFILCCRGSRCLEALTQAAVPLPPRISGFCQVSKKIQAWAPNSCGLWGSCTNFPPLTITGRSRTQFFHAEQSTRQRQEEAIFFA